MDSIINFTSKLFGKGTTTPRNNSVDESSTTNQSTNDNNTRNHPTHQQNDTNRLRNNQPSSRTVQDHSLISSQYHNRRRRTSFDLYEQRSGSGVPSETHPHLYAIDPRSSRYSRGQSSGRASAPILYQDIGGERNLVQQHHQRARSTSPVPVPFSSMGPPPPSQYTTTTVAPTPHRNPPVMGRNNLHGTPHNFPGEQAFGDNFTPHHDMGNHQSQVPFFQGWGSQGQGGTPYLGIDTPNSTERGHTFNPRRVPSGKYLFDIFK